MTCVAGLVAGDAVILKMSGGNVTGIINVEAPAIVFHDVAGKAELRFLRALQMFQSSRYSGEYWQDA
jgi:hypothetical protein